jgi:hypothetical protein
MTILGLVSSGICGVAKTERLVRKKPPKKINF